MFMENSIILMCAVLSWCSETGCLMQKRESYRVFHLGKSKPLPFVVEPKGSGKWKTCENTNINHLISFQYPDTIKENLSHTITLPHGKIQGHELRSSKNEPYFAFQDIPYASPPVGELRFKEAIPPKSWKGVLDTTQNTKVCMQLEAEDPRESEDCLYLNVYTPRNPLNSSTSHLLPVYVYIHGGVFLNGFGTFDNFGPQYLMDYGIVVVTLNYRLGAFGFLSTGDDVLPGNLGMKDQNFALKWVKRNIHLFGGDPSKVTLGGQSAGSAAVGHHILSKKSKGLFREAIMESGTALCAKMFQRNPRYFAFTLGTLLDSNFGPHNSSQDLLRLLQRVPAEEIKKNSNIDIPEELKNFVGNEDNRIWAPVEDGSFVVGPMHENLKNGHFNLVPLLIGVNSEEQMHFNLEKLKGKAGYFDSNASFLINGNLNIKKENRESAGKALKEIYTKHSFEADFGSFVRFISDAKYTTASARHAVLQSKYTDVYFYQFSYHGLLNNNNQTVAGAERVGHTEELFYLFKRPSNKDLNRYPKEDLETQTKLLKLWTNFIKFSNPTPTKESILSSMMWPKVKPDAFLYVNISSKLEIRKNPKEYQKWKKVYDEYAEKTQVTY